MSEKETHGTEKYGIYTLVFYMCIKANGYRILTTTSIIQNFALFSNTKWILIMTMLGRSISGKDT